MSRLRVAIILPAWVTAFFTFDLILFGAFTRLTDSGLGCPDWPGCYAHSNPLIAADEIRAAESAMPGGPVTMGKAWIEMIHRYLAMGVGVLILILMVHAWQPLSRKLRTPWLATVVFFVVCLQGALGAFTVTLKLQPAIVTLHLLFGMALLALLVWLALHKSDLFTPKHAAIIKNARLRIIALVAFVVLFMQIGLGGWVSANYAVLACPDYPLCYGQLVPPMDFSHGFTLWRKLGMTAMGELLPFNALVAIQWTHRTFAWAVFVIAGVAALLGARVNETKKASRWIGVVLAIQFFTGFSTVLFQWPLALAIAHNVGAAVLVAP